MYERYRVWYWLIAAILLGRVLTMAAFPLVETTEPRYAEIARLMLASGDWITPWFEPGTPFWGKPPLSFWAQALSMSWFGVHELAARLPSWFAMVLTVGLMARFATLTWGRAEGVLSALALVSMGLGFVSAGAVMTDPFLLLGATLSLLSFAEVMLGGTSRSARWFVFLGLVIGLLAKGPLVLVLVGMPIVVWTLSERNWHGLWRSFPWFWGIMLTLVLTVPWYVAAELKTPGFIDYFIVGEHFRRFLDPGWQGDLYGSAHQQPHGMIWVFWLWATFPWGVLMLVSLAWPETRRRAWSMFRSDTVVRFLCWAALAPLVFFTLSGNTLWTYVLPALPFFALLFARMVFVGMNGVGAKTRRNLTIVAVIVPLLITAGGLYVAIDEGSLNTEKPLVAQYQSSRGSARVPLFYLDEVPFSARFYLRGAVAVTDPDRLARQGERYFVAARKRRIPDITGAVDGRVEVRYQGKRHTLLEVHPGPVE
ncbi:ArnT family glycosyltransferase [Marinobacter lacisalsi]|uniref:ArnT family glycosyltransferase n=1 Tax=Marinobacter lacisalsi TaxID=475979 RepID=A0ABV8QJD0_9GAMM